MRITEADLSVAADLLKRGEVVAFPTETVYGLGARIFSEEAIKKIFSAKRRPSDNPLIAHIADLEEVDTIGMDIPPVFYRLADRFFPGPLTLIVPKRKEVPESASGGLATIGIRMPRQNIARALIRAVGEPLVAPSANVSGKPSATSYEHVLEDFDGSIAGVIMGNPSEIGIESTVLSLSGPIPVLARPGSISREELEEFLGMSIGIPDKETHRAPISPGMKYRHYAPKAPVIVYFNPEEAECRLQNFPFVKRVLLSNRNRSSLPDTLSLPLGVDSFYAGLRSADRASVEEVIIVCDEEIIGDPALMNRIEKAAGIEIPTRFRSI